MTIRRILLPVADREDFAQTADFAFVLAHHHEAEVQGVHPQHHAWIDEWLDNWGLSEGEIEKLEQQARRSARAAERRAQDTFERQASRHSAVAARFMATTGKPVRSLLDLAIYADMTVLGNLAGAADTRQNLPLTRMLGQSTRPLFVTPPRPVDRHLGGRVVIAWNQSQEAARAVAAAMPLIDRAERVDIVCVGKRGGPAIHRPAAGLPLPAHAAHRNRHP